MIIYDIKGLLSWGRLRALVLYYPLTLGLLLVIGWPTSYTLNSPVSPWLPVWSALLCTLFGGYEALRTAAQIVPRPDDVHPLDWVRYTHAAPATVLIGKLVSSLLTEMVWLAVATPLLLMATQPVSYSLRLGSLYVYWLLVAAALSYWGVWAACRIQKRSTKSWLLSGLWTAAFLAPLLPLEAPGSFLTPFMNGSPARVVKLLAASPSAQSLPPVGAALFPLFLVFLTGLAVAWFELRRWQGKDLPANQELPR